MIMENVARRTALLSLSAIERVLTPLATKWVKLVKKRTFSEKVFMKEGVFPVIDHYYYPLINPRRDLKKSLRDDRKLLGIDLNTEEQLNLLQTFCYNEELESFPLEKRKDGEFFYNNTWYEAGDAEYLYNMVRHFKPGKIVEIGCGSSTLMIRNALVKNKSEAAAYTCQHICVEPYEQPWLEKIDATIIRKKVEEIDLSFFQQLQRNDILFIDSSHIIRPQGDVLFEYLELLPVLNPGVLIHIHDIFTPKDYLDEWVYKHYFWNEQYLVEAFLSFNSKFRIIGALNYLAHNYRNEFSAKCPVFAQQFSEPKALWLIRN
jgi:predicted O-methyltransferase YrrM